MKSRAGEDASYPANPFRGFEEVGNHYLAATEASNGEAEYFIAAPDYRRTKPNSLVIALHGGGSGGYEKAREYAGIAIRGWLNRELHRGFVVIAPIARNHVASSWGNRTNMHDLLDAIEDTLERFNINRRRLYLTGQSMGGGGTTLLYMRLPELAAAYCARAGFYHQDRRARDVLEKPIMIIHGEKDIKSRTESRDKVAARIEALGGDLTRVSLPEVDHFIGNHDVFPRMLPFSESHENEIEPDIDLLRTAVDAWFK
jgi:predicted peptidase